MNPQEAIERIESAGWKVRLDTSKFPPDAWLIRVSSEQQRLSDCSHGETIDGLWSVYRPLSDEQERWFQRHKQALITYMLQQHLTEERRRSREMLDQAYLYYQERLAEERRRFELMLSVARWQVAYLEESAKSATIPPDMLKRLKSLCHPDRWQGQPQERSATEVMQWLNQQEARA